MPIQLPTGGAQPQQQGAMPSLAQLLGPDWEAKVHAWQWSPENFGRAVDMPFTYGGKNLALHIGTNSNDDSGTRTYQVIEPGNKGFGQVQFDDSGKFTNAAAWHEAQNNFVPFALSALGLGVGLPMMLGEGAGGAALGSGAGFVGEGALSGIPAWDAAAAGGGLGSIAPSVALTPGTLAGGSQLVPEVIAGGAGSGAMGAGGAALGGAEAAGSGAFLGEGMASGVPAWDAAATGAGLSLATPAAALSTGGLFSGGLGSLAQWAGPAASLIGGIMGSNAANKASDAQLQAAREAMALNEPFRQGGIKGMNRLLDLLGLSGNTSAEGYGSAAKDFSMADFQADPGYAFRQSEGQKALERSAAARGGLLSGRAMKDTMRFGQDLASQEYGNAYNRYNTNRAAKLNPLQSLMGAGQSAANTVGEYRTQAGNAQAAGQVGSANAWTNALSGAIGSYQQNQLLDMLKSRGSMYAG